MRRLALVALAALMFAACGDRECETTDTAPACDWETQLWDGAQCLSRTDHEAHMGG